MCGTKISQGMTPVHIYSEHRELYSNMGMRIEYTIFLMMRLKSFRPEIDKNWQPRRECQKYKKKSLINDFKTKMILASTESSTATWACALNTQSSL